MKKSENLKKGISAFVDLTNYSQSHLARLIKKHFGMGLKQYINELRLRQAYDDFVWTNESAEVIAENLGFCSYSHFYRIFKGEQVSWICGLIGNPCNQTFQIIDWR